MSTETVPAPSAPSARPDSHARIVVGVDGSQGSSTALAWALREARLRDEPVHVVYAWQYHQSWDDPGLGTMFPLGYGSDGGRIAGLPPGIPPDLSSGDPDAGHSPLRGRDDAEAAVANLLDGAIADTLAANRPAPGAPAVHLTRQTIEGHPGAELLSAVTPDDLLVVGARGHGRFVEALLGSISRHVVAGAPCPVVVVPDRMPHHQQSV